MGENLLPFGFQPAILERVRANIGKVETIIVVMLENRSFDHMLGYLSLDEFGGCEVEGLHNDPAWLQEVASVYQESRFTPWHSNDPFRKLDADPPHERTNIEMQLGQRVDGKNDMKGFVQNYATVAPVQPGDNPSVMSYFGPAEVPITHFLAEHFCVCDKWFSALPAGTQPNRLMAMGGETVIDTNTHILPNQPLIYDWLTDHKISWRVYHEGMPFFAMMPRWVPHILDTNLFRRFDRLVPDISEAAPGELPSVLFIEPAYTDAPHIGRSSDDHAPSGASAGQEFLMKVYNAVTYDLEVWNKTVMIVTYDEHGGFFDHVSPIDLHTAPPKEGSYRPFQTSGVRVPAFVVSPFVKAKQPYRGVLDHTSILKFIGQRFGENGSYNATVSARKVGSVLDVLDFGAKAEPVPAPELNEYVNRGEAAGFTTPGTPPYNEIMKSFQTAIDMLHAHSPSATEEKFPELLPFVTRK